jgi:16S rRNA (uracil1498-N3)-methyltransferase
MRRFFIHPDEIVKIHPSISGSEARHMARVLRMSFGKQVLLFDGTGKEYEALISGISSQKVEFNILREIPLKSESEIELICAQAYLKDKKMDLLSRQLTELGVSTWIPFISDHSIPKPTSTRFALRKERWEKITIEAMKQCRRRTPLRITALFSFDECLEYGKPFTHKILFWEKEQRSIHPDAGELVNPPKQIMVILGPEGGFSDQEVKKATSFGFSIASLGPRILKAETAAVASCVLIQYLFGDMGQKVIDKK